MVGRHAGGLQRRVDAEAFAPVDGVHALVRLHVAPVVRPSRRGLRVVVELFADRDRRRRRTRRTRTRSRRRRR